MMINEKMNKKNNYYIREKKVKIFRKKHLRAQLTNHLFQIKRKNLPKNI